MHFFNEICLLNTANSVIQFSNLANGHESNEPNAQITMQIVNQLNLFCISGGSASIARFLVFYKKYGGEFVHN